MTLPTPTPLEVAHAEIDRLVRAYANALGTITSLTSDLQRTREALAWRPIATAPKDGTLFMGWGKRRGGTFVAYWKKHARARDGGWWLSATGETCRQNGVDLTHWLPLLTPPTGT